MKLHSRVILLAACAIGHIVQASELEENLSETTLTESQCTATVKKVQASGKFTEDAILPICSSEVKSAKCDFFAEALSLASTHTDFTSKVFCKDMADAHACSQMMDNLYQSTTTKDLLYGECMRAAEVKSAAYCEKFKSLLARSVHESDLDTMRACYMVQAYDQKDGEMASPAKTEAKKESKVASPVAKEAPAKTEAKKESRVASPVVKEAPAKTEAKKESKVASPVAKEASTKAHANATRMASPAKPETKKTSKVVSSVGKKATTKPIVNGTSQLAKAQAVTKRGSAAKATKKATTKATIKVTTAAIKQRISESTSKAVTNTTKSATKAATKKETKMSQTKGKVAHPANKVVALAKRHAKIAAKDKKTEEGKKYGGFLSGFVM